MEELIAALREWRQDFTDYGRGATLTNHGVDHDARDARVAAAFDALTIGEDGICSTCNHTTDGRRCFVLLPRLRRAEVICGCNHAAVGAEALTQRFGIR